MPLLMAVNGPREGERFPLQPQTIVGRALDATVRIDNLMVTRRHCVISATPRGYAVEDLGSRNGTYVNDERISGPTALKEGDLVRVHKSVFRFLAEADLSSTVTLVDMPGDGTSAIVEAVDVTKVTAARPPTNATTTSDFLAREHERLQTVMEIGNAVGAHVELDDLLNEVMDRFFGVFSQMDRGFIMLKVEGVDDLQVKLSRHRDKRTAEDIAVSKHIIDEAVRQRMGILSADAMDDDRFANAGSVMDYQIRSMMCAPLMATDELLGVIHVDTTRQDNRFDREDLELFTAVANQTALAIGYAGMHQRLRRRQRIEHDLAMARHVQTSFLPDALPELAGMEFSVTYRAALEVGGDFYDFIPLKDGRLGIVLGDVMGKGMTAALTMARMMSDVRSLALSAPEPVRVLQGLNEGLIRRGTTDTFVTGLFMVLDPATRELTFSNAAHSPPLLRRGSTGEVLEVEKAESGLCLGVEESTEYAQETITLEPGDCLLSYTDGLTEAQSVQLDYYGLERLLKAVDVPETTPTALMAAVLDDMRAFVGETSQSDDLTILCFGAT